MTSRDEITAHIASLAKQYEYIADGSFTEDIIGHHKDIFIYQIQLNAYCSMLTARNVEEFLLSAIRDAESFLDSLRGTTLIAEEE